MPVCYHYLHKHLSRISHRSSLFSWNVGSNYNLKKSDTNIDWTQFRNIYIYIYTYIYIYISSRGRPKLAQKRRKITWKIIMAFHKAVLIPLFYSRCYNYEEKLTLHFAQQTCCKTGWFVLTRKANNTVTWELLSCFSIEKPFM